MKSILHSLVAAASAALLVSCGTVGSLQPTAALSPGSKFHAVVVRDFTASVPEDELEVGMRARGGYPDRIVAVLHHRAPSLKVSRNGAAGPGTLVVSGHITRCEDGSAALRLWIGMGAGSSIFDATTTISDGGKGAVLGTIKHHKNSWPLGGAIASTQTVESFMDMAAEKTAEEVVKLTH